MISEQIMWISWNLEKLFLQNLTCPHNDKKESACFDSNLSFHNSSQKGLAFLWQVTFDPPSHTQTATLTSALWLIAFLLPLIPNVYDSESLQQKDLEIKNLYNKHTQQEFSPQ